MADWAAIKSLSNLLAEVGADLVQSFDTKPNLLVPFAARRVPDVSVIRTINGLGWLYSSRAPSALALAPVYRMLHRLAARSTDLTVFQNRDDKVFFERHGMLAEGTGRLIPGSGIDVERFEQATASGPSPAALRQTLGLAPFEVVVSVTRMTRQKGIPTLLEAAALVHEVRPNVRFLLVGPRQGEGPFAVTQAEIDRHDPYVMAIGPRSDIPALLGLADVFAFPTEYREGVPRALLEAALAGLPIVTTQMPGCCDVVRDGWTGLLVPPRAPRCLAEGILDLLHDRERARAMGHRAAELVRQEFNLGITVDRYAALYTELMDRRIRSAGHRAQGDRPAPTRRESLPEIL
jgi:glycosyltransferase involved in cell wall biosynthesis